MLNEQYFSPCPRGLEAVLASELERCGASVVTAGGGGVRYSGTLETGYRVNLWSRVASRVLRQVAHAPYKTEQDVYALAHSVDWSKRFGVDRAIRVDVVGVKSPLKSLDFATLRIKDAICDRFRDAVGRRPDVDTREPDVRVSAFLTATHATLYFDLSGEPLFKRGYRREAGEAPLKENLAAGLVILSGWDGGTPFYDPMCGSGTIAIEAALIARNIAPGLKRRFAFEQLGDFDAALWSRLRDDAQREQRKIPTGLIRASDIYGRVLERARNAAALAGVDADIVFDSLDVLEAHGHDRAGVLLTNPPYGVRVSERETLATLYPKLAAVLKSRFPGWRCYFFTADLELPKLLRLKESKRTPLFNGALECRMFEFKMVAGSNRA